MFLSYTLNFHSVFGSIWSTASNCSFLLWSARGWWI